MIVKNRIVNSNARLVVREEYADFPLRYEYLGQGRYLIKDPLLQIGPEKPPQVRKVAQPQKQEEIESDPGYEALQLGSKFCDRIPKDLLMFPNFYFIHAKMLARRCDGLWIDYIDPIAVKAILSVYHPVEVSGLPIQFELAREVFRNTYLSQFEADFAEQGDEGMEEFFTLAPHIELIADYMLGSAIATALFGPYKPSEFGYVPDFDHSGFSEDEMEEYSVYSGSMALYEKENAVQVFHMLTSHAYRPLEGGGLDGITVLALLNEYSRPHREAWGALSQGRYACSITIVHELLKRKVRFADSYPEPLP
jgi:hypothetical protein